MHVATPNGMELQMIPDMPQSMVDGSGKPKGLRKVLLERGLWRDGLALECNSCLRKDTEEQKQLSDEAGVFGGRGKDFCCARGVMRKQPDFLAQRVWLREVKENVGHKIIYYPTWT